MKETCRDYEEARFGTTTNHTQYEPEIVLYAIAHLPIVFTMSIFTLLCTWSLTSLMCFHGIIISMAQTTNEHVRNVYQIPQNGNHNNNGNGENGDASRLSRNPADKGCIDNWIHALCSPVPESRLPRDFSEMVDCCEGRQMRDQCLIITTREKELECDDSEDNDDEGQGLIHVDERFEAIYDSQRAAKAVATSVEQGIVYSA